MPEEFTGQPLKALDRLYRFPGGSDIRSFETDSAIQPVHDVSREAELASGLSGEFGYYIQSVEMAHAGAGSLFGTIDPWAQADVRARERASVAVWVVSMFGTADVVARFVTGLAALSYPLLPDTFPLAAAVSDMLLYQWDSASDASRSGGIGMLTDVATSAQRAQMPIYVPDGGIIQVSSEAQTGAVDIAISGLFWAGAFGVTPPGMP